MSDERVVYEINEVVWAKIRGYPWWPAYVSGVIKSSSQPGQVEYIVNFYGDTSQQPVDNRIDSARLAPDKVAKFQSNYAEFEQKARSSKKLAKSVLIAQEALKSQGFNYVFEKRPARRPSKAHSKLSSEMQSSDHIESELADSQNRSASKGFRPSPDKRQVGGVKESPKVKAEPMQIEPVIVPSPVKKQTTPKLTPIKEQPKQSVVAIPLLPIKESKAEKQTDKDNKQTRDRSQRATTKENKQQKDLKQKETKEVREAREAKEAKEAKQELTARASGQRPVSEEDDDDQPPLKKQFRSVQPSRKSKPKTKRSASKVEETDDPPKHKKEAVPPPAPPPEPINQLLVTVDKVKSLLTNPRELINYLTSIEITVKNVKQILDCEVVDILHETKEPVAKEILKSLKATLISRYFDDEVTEKIKVRRSTSENAHSDSKKDDIRSKTRHKAQIILRKHFVMNEQQTAHAASQLESALHQKDPTGGATYKKLALETLNHLKVMLKIIQNRTFTVDETLKRIASNSLSK